MNNLATQLHWTAAALSSAEVVVKRFQELRDFCSEEQWDEFTSAGPLGELLDACSDLEYDLERE